MFWVGFAAGILAVCAALLLLVVIGGTGTGDWEGAPRKERWK